MTNFCLKYLGNAIVIYLLQAKIYFMAKDCFTPTDGQLIEFHARMVWVIMAESIVLFFWVIIFIYLTRKK